MAIWKSPAYLLAGLVFLTPCAFAADVNTARFLGNSGFEEGTDTVPCWRGEGAKNLKFKRDTQDFKSGAASLRIEAGVNGEACEGDVMTDLWKSVPRGAFVISGFVKLKGAFEKAQILAQSLGEGGAGKDWVIIADVKPGADWQPFSKEIDFAADSKFARLHLQVKGQGVLLLDDLKIETADAPKVNEAADKKPIGQQTVQFNGTKQYNWDQVAVGAGGTPTALAIHPKDPTVIYAAMDIGGPMRWNVKAKRWTPLADQFGPDQVALYHTECLALDAGNPDVVLYSAGKEWTSGKPSILKSANRGATWTIVPLKNRDGKDVYITNGRTGKRLAIDPNNSTIVFYGSRKDGLFKSVSGGDKWRQIVDFPDFPTSPDGVNIGFILFDAASGRMPNTGTKKIYVEADFEDKSRSGIYCSDDGGVNWKKLEGAPSGVGELDSQGTLYVAGQGVKRWRKNTWEDITPDKSLQYSAIAISPANPNIIVCVQDHCGGGNNLFRTMDGGKNWTKYSDDDFENRGKKSIHGEMQPWEGGTNGAHIFACASDLAFDRADPKKLWMTHWPGVWSCRDITADILQWRAEMEGYEEASVFDAVSPSKGAPLISGMIDVGGFRHANLSQMPAKQMVGIKTPYNGAPEDVTDIDFCEGDANFIAVTGGWKYQDGTSGPKNAAAGFSTDNGVTWQNFASTPFEGARGGRIAVNAANRDNMVWIPRDTLGGDDKGNTPAYFTKDRGQTWQAATGAPLGMVYGAFVYTFYQPLEADRVKADTFYLWDRRDGRFYRSEDGGATWKHSATLPAQSGANFDQHTLRAAPGIAGEVWVAANDKGLFRSSDAGESWTKLQGIERAWRFGWGFNKAKAPVAYVLGTVRGDNIARTVALYRSDDMGKTWLRLDDANRGWGQASVINGDRQVPGRVYVGTNGRGIFYGDSAIEQIGFGGGSPGPTMLPLIPLPGVVGIGIHIMPPPGQPEPCPLNKNLLGNYSAQLSPGTEFGTKVIRPIKYWQPFGNFTVKGIPIPDFGNSFVGGPDSSFSGARQRVGMVSTCWPTIDAGAMHFLLDGLLGGYAAENDNTLVKATFWGWETDPETGKKRQVYLGSAWIGPVKAIHRHNATQYLKVGVTHWMPPGTRWVDIDVEMSRTDGTYNEASADDLSFMIFEGWTFDQARAFNITLKQPTPDAPYGFHFPYGSFNSSGWVLVTPQELRDLSKPVKPQNSAPDKPAPAPAAGGAAPKVLK